jgi:hypothetical protein
MCAAKIGRFSTTSCSQRQVIKNVVDGNQDNENATFRSTIGGHQYFILDKELLTDQDAKIITSARGLQVGQRGTAAAAAAVDRVDERLMLDC